MNTQTNFNPAAHVNAMFEPKKLFDLPYWYNILSKFLLENHPDILDDLNRSQTYHAFIKGRISTTYDLFQKNLDANMQLDVNLQEAFANLVEGFEFSLYNYLAKQGQEQFPDFYKHLNDRGQWEMHLVSTCLIIRDVLKEDAFNYEKVKELPLQSFFTDKEKQ